jgi:hypothetical protein
VASNGNDFLAVWQDQRRSGYAGYDIYGSRIDRDGQTLKPLGRRIADASSHPVIASAGSDYLVVYQNSTGVMAQRLDQDGAPLGTARLVADKTWSPRLLTSNGSNYLLVVAGTGDKAILLDRDGVPLRTLWTGSGNPIAAGVHGGSYVVVDYSIIGSGVASAQPLLRTMNDDGTVSARSLPNVVVSSSHLLAAALSPDRILFVWPSEGGSLRFLVAGYNGELLRDPMTITTPVPLDYQPVASWSGSAFNVAYGRGTASVEVIRITADGTMVDSSRSVLTSHRSDSYPAFASGNATQIVVWPDRRQGDDDILARTFTSIDSLAAAPDQGNLISWSVVESMKSRSGSIHRIKFSLRSTGRPLQSG